MQAVVADAASSAFCLGFYMSNLPVVNQGVPGILPCALFLQVWECRSRIARTLIASKCLTAFRIGLLQYLALLWMCLMAFLGLNVGAKAAMFR